MDKRKICLFTAHSPMVGGGGVIIRSLVENLTEFNIEWNYIANGKVPGYEKGYMGKGINGNGFAKEIIETWKMLSLRPSEIINEIISELLAMDCDAYWIVSHNEGLRVALELRRAQKSKPVHITFHDDWAGALCARSSRYRWLRGHAERLTIVALRECSGFDVISEGMKEYYKTISGHDGEVCHRYLPANSVSSAHFNISHDTGKLVAGHIGSIYDKTDFLSFLQLFKDFAAKQNKTASLQMWGCHLTMEDIPSHLQDTIVFNKELPEAQVIPLLSRCDFVYAMYPFAKRLRIFGKTSLPTKLSSYMQTGRPVFGHGPADSTLADFLQITGTGVIWGNTNTNSGLNVFEKINEIKPDIKHWQLARNKYFGEINLDVMRKALGVFSYAIIERTLVKS